MLGRSLKELRVRKDCKIGCIDLNTLVKINLSRCGLKDIGLIQIIRNAPNNLKDLDISENSTLGLKWYEELAHYLDKRDIE